MTRAAHIPLPPELEHVEIDPRSIHAFRHGFPSPLVRWHLHHDYELHYIVASAGTMFVGDHIGEFAPGQLVMTGPCLPHNWISETHRGSSVEIRDCVVQFRKHLLPAMSAHAAELSALLPLLDRARCGIEFRGPVLDGAEAWFDDIIASEGSRRVGLLIEFLGRLSRERDYRLLSTTPLLAETEVASLDTLDRLIRHITEHHGDDTQIASAAGLLGMDNAAFSRFFTRLTGLSFTQFVNRVRVAHACRLLGASDDSVTEIAHRVGYNNIANFNRRFRELKDMTPREYRKRSRVGHTAEPVDLIRP